MTRPYMKVPSLAPYVRKKSDKDEAQLAKAADGWLDAWAKNHISYEIEWLGVPVIQSPEDLLLMQELIYTIRPDVIVETGIAHGGSLIYYASIFELLKHGRIIGVDVEIRKHNREVLEQHPLFPRITLIEGSSVDRKIVDEVTALIEPDSRVLVCLDSDHTRGHVLRELELYSKLVPVGSYIVVFDTVTDALARRGIADSKYIENDPSWAVRDFLAGNDSFVVDKHFDRLWITASPGGYLKRVK